MLRRTFKRAAYASGLAPLISSARFAGRLLINPHFRRLQQMTWAEYLRWRRYAPVLRPSLLPAGARPRRALIVTKGTVLGAEIELGLIKALELAGFTSVVLTDSALEKFYRLAGVSEFVRWESLTEPAPIGAARALVAGATRVEDLLGVEHAGARVGKFAASTTFRWLKVGRLDFSDPKVTGTLAEHLADGMARASAAWTILDRVKPDLALFMGNRYTGQGELMDVCLTAGVDVLTWFDAHRSRSLMLKRYRLDNRDRHHGSIADETWEQLRAMPWGHEHDAALRREIDDAYASGDWYSRGGTQVNKSIVSADALRAQLGLDPAKKTAVIFPHIVWDATLFWGADLFANYEDWLVATVRAAAENPRVNWIIKIHPAHVAKSAMERYDGAPAELTAIRERVGALPPHVVVVPPDTNINTFALFPVMDYCVTVRGTIGIEAANAGACVLTAGSGRYDRRGFTTDSDTQEQYLHRLATIETLPAPTQAQVDLARRFAYGTFVVRPWRVTALSIDHGRDIEATTSVSLNVSSSDALHRSPDLVAFAEWAADGRQEDFVSTGLLPALSRSA